MATLDPTSTIFSNAGSHSIRDAVFSILPFFCKFEIIFVETGNKKDMYCNVETIIKKLQMVMKT